MSPDAKWGELGSVNLMLEGEIILKYTIYFTASARGGKKGSGHLSNLNRGLTMVLRTSYVPFHES